MAASKAVSRSILSFLLVCTAIAVFYIVTGAFGGDDVNDATRFFGAVQLTLLILVSLFFIWSLDRRNRMLTHGFNIFLFLLLFIQLAPSYLWIAMSGSDMIFNTQEGLGVMAHWSYGAVHIVIMVWGLLNAIAFHKQSVKAA